MDLYRGEPRKSATSSPITGRSSDRRPQALPYLVTAADGAVAVGANQEAIGHLQSAWRSSRHPTSSAPVAQQAAIRLKLAGLHFITGER